MRSLFLAVNMLLAGLLFGACGGESQTPAAEGTTPGSSGGLETGPGQVVYQLSEGALFRVVVAEDAKPESLAAQLDRISPGLRDEWINVAPDGGTYLISTERFGCEGWACLALIQGDLSSGEVIRAGDEPLHPNGYGAVASGGRRAVYPDNGGPHEMDLWLTERLDEGGWSTPRLLTGGSKYAWNSQPAFSADGERIVFDCGNVPYGQEGTAICEVTVADAEVAVVITPHDGPDGTEANALHHPDYAPDGSIMFEADWQGGERVWRVTGAGAEPDLVTLDPDGTANSPCVLPDGRMSDLWLERPEGRSEHEIRVNDLAAGTSFMLVIDIDVADSGYGCGAAPWATVS